MKLYTSMYRTLRFALAVVLVSTVGFAPRIADAQHELHYPEAKRTVSVSGEGIIDVEPDMATVRFGIVTVVDQPEEARRLNAEAAARAMNAVRELGIEDRYIRMETLRLQPHREWVNDDRRWVERGYEAVRQVVVEVHDLETLPTLVAEVVQQGANRLEQVSYDLEDRESARNEALQAAVESAREKARIVANTLGEELGPVQSVNEQSFDFPRPVVDLRSETMEAKLDAAAPEPDAYAAGEIEVRVNVSATFELQ